MKTWLDLKPGDSLYLLVPITGEHGLVKYDLQKSKVINTHIFGDDDNGKYITIRFKYTNNDGYRKRVDCLIYKYNIENPFVINAYSQNKLEKAWGNLVICHDEDDVRTTYEKMIAIKKKELDELLNAYNKYIFELNDINYDSI